jgi:hypothetical protein
MVEDLCQIAAAPVDKLKSFADALEAEEGFVGDKRLKELLKAHLGSDDLFEPVGRALGNFKPAEINSTLSKLEKWRTQRPENAEKLDERTIDELKTKLPVLVRGYRAIGRQRKANYLNKVLGMRGEDVEIICDARPVYNDSRDTIEGLLPIITLKLEYTNRSDEEETFEIVLPAKLLKKLSEESTKAEIKLNALSKSIEQWLPNGLPEID